VYFRLLLKQVIRLESLCLNLFSVYEEGFPDK